MALVLSVDPQVSVSASLRARVRREVARMVKAAALREGRRDLEVALRLTDDPTIHELNCDWRGKDKPTDVLAFAQRPQVKVPRGRSEWPTCEVAAAAADLLGDIVISLDTARRQARRGLYAELVHLASHGLCHLLGYDHRDDAEERVMNARAAGLRREARRGGRVRAA